METYRLWLEQDMDIPQLKKLACEITDVDISEILTKGIHPWGDRHACRSLIERFLQLFNEERHKIAALVGLGYCETMDSYPHHYYGERSQFEELVNRINQSVRFVPDLTFREMLSLAKSQLENNWNHNVVKQLVSRVYYNFNDLRSFIKAKCKKVKLRSYDDLDTYDLSKVLCLKDFETEDKVIISQGLPVTNFRRESFLNQVTNKSGLIKLAESIPDFELSPVDSVAGYGYSKLIFNGTFKDGEIFLTPTLTESRDIRSEAQMIAAKWRLDDSKYCFRTSIANLSRMHTEDRMQIRFPHLDYIRKKSPAESSGKLKTEGIKTFSIGGFVTVRSSGDTIKEILRHYQVPMTGTKDKLLEKLAKLTAREYKKHKSEMERYFQENRFVKITNSYGQSHSQFPILDTERLRNLLLTLFAFRHLRGNVILDTDYENDAVDLVSLAKSLVNEEITLSGTFLRVED